jgi:glucose-1-phosphate thymidylyltransferase
VTPTKAVVLAQAHRTTRGGPTTRTPRSSLPPAPLLPVANRCLLGHALGWLEQAGVRAAAVVVPEDMADQARHAASDVRPTLATSWLEQAPGETLAESLGELADFLGGEPFVLHLSDSLAGQSLRSLTAGEGDGEGEAVLIVDESSEHGLADVVQLRTATGGADWHHRTLPSNAAGVAVMSAHSLEVHGELDLTPDRILETLTEGIRERGGRVRTRSVSDWWRFRGGAEALLEGNRFALETLKPVQVKAHMIDTHTQGPVSIHPSARLESSLVRGPAVIGPRAHLRDAYVGPYTSIGPGVIIEGAEVENSMVLAEASIRHLGGRLEASVVGPRARVFRDFRLPRALRLSVGEGAEVAVT